jgi:hypothetical protein
MKISGVKIIINNSKIMNNRTLEKLRLMRLYGMHDAFKTSLENTLKGQMPPGQFIFRLVSNEWDNRRNRAIGRAIKAAAFRYNASLEEIGYSFERGLDRNQADRLAPWYSSGKVGNRQKLSGNSFRV